ncbi:RBBP9/YdeN family alpha/beta hydrolase [Acinetobacter johnsonii]|uniref:Serine hydrolase family protein n=1 Tax=Acinetobacter johnsonii TaxID=40214 RepID=A0A3Q8XGL6_ACIJO|nr:alpha/beta hydrolase [Acinetobacter johnsonii]AZN64995.1 hypothetical protein CFH90_13555 [Acinetobacter johnsonii]MDH1704405.1 alpha/beta hydrolase [Acinetobacter johnsonii]
MNGSKQHIYIVHGYQASPNDHWFPWLSQKLSQMDLHAEVKRLVLPHSDAPHFEEWQQALALQMTTLDENTIIIAHSLGCLATLHYLSSKLRERRIKAILCIAGFKAALTTLPELSGFIAQAKLDSGILHSHIASRVVMFSNNDPYVPPPLALTFGHFLSAEVLEVKRAGHFMRENGYAEFELLFNTLKPLLQQQAVAQG